MKKILSICTLIMLTSSIIFSGCRKNGGNIESENGNVSETKYQNTLKETESETDIDSNKQTTSAAEQSSTTETEAGTEESTQGATEPAIEETNKLVQYTCNENDIPKAMMDIVKNSTSCDVSAYLYGDIDNDSDKELLAAYLDVPLGQWVIVKLENETSTVEDFYSIKLLAHYDYCSLGLITLKDKIQYVVNLSSSMSTSANGYILEEAKEGIKEVQNLSKTIWQAEDGGIIVQNTSYGSCLDKTTGELIGRVWTYSYLTYDEDTGMYKEYVAREITEAEFLAFEGAADVKQSIMNQYADVDVKMSFYKRNNGIMHVQCEYEKDNIIIYEYTTVYYNDKGITGKSEIQQGIVEKKATHFEEI